MHSQVQVKRLNGGQKIAHLLLSCSSGLLHLMVVRLDRRPIQATHLSFLGALRQPVRPAQRLSSVSLFLNHQSGLASAPVFRMHYQDLPIDHALALARAFERNTTTLQELSPAAWEGRASVLRRIAGVEGAGRHPQPCASHGAPMQCVGGGVCERCIVHTSVFAIPHVLQIDPEHSNDAFRIESLRCGILRRGTSSS